MLRPKLSMMHCGLLALVQAAGALGCSGADSGTEIQDELPSPPSGGVTACPLIGPGCNIPLPPPPPPPTLPGRGRGDFTGDRKYDIALTGGVGWTTIPIARSDGTGGFSVTNFNVPEFPIYAAQSGAKPVSGDFNNDGRGDIALTGGFQPNGSPWNTVPVAFSAGTGDFLVTTNTNVANFALFATQQGAKPVSGDFNNDGRDDIALTGGFSSPGVPWTTIPIAFSNGNGSFNVTNATVANFPLYATQRNAKPISGDFNGDGRDDIALTGGFQPDNQPWTTIPVAFSNGNGTFNVTNVASATIPNFAADPRVKPVGGDFNGDGRTDIALTALPGDTIRIGYSNGNGSFTPANIQVTSFTTFARQGATPVSGDFNNDGRFDIALTGGFASAGVPWTTVPVAFSNANGTFTVTNKPVANFPLYATQNGAKPVGAG